MGGEEIVINVHSRKSIGREFLLWLETISSSARKETIDGIRYM